jgi:iron complex outermembrane receptor protein
MKSRLLAAPLVGALVVSSIARAEDPDGTIVVVAGVSPDADAPVSRSELSAEDLAQTWHGQEIAWSIADTPSVMAWSDSGLGYGYSYFGVRGLYQARMVVTFDGAPLNDLLDMGVFSSNFAGLSASLSGMQVQRGIGTGSVGAASFAGAVHLQSAEPPEVAGGELQVGVGSFGWKRASLALNTGEIRPGWTATVRLSG